MENQIYNALAVGLPIGTLYFIAGIGIAYEKEITRYIIRSTSPLLNKIKRTNSRQKPSRLENS
jgi:hypothetical protein